MAVAEDAGKRPTVDAGEGNLLRDWLDAGTATKYYQEGAREEDDRRSDGLRREYTRLNYHTGSLRFGYQLSGKWRVETRGERFVANNVEAPSDIAFGNAEPSTKDIARTNGEVSLSGHIARHKLSLRGYAARENNDNNSMLATGQALRPYLSFQSSARWRGLQLKDVYQLNRHALIVGVDHTHAATRSRAYNSNLTERAPYSPNYNLVSTAMYAQGQFRFLADRLILNPGARYDLITYEVKTTPLLNTYSPGKETNPFFSPSLAAQYQVASLLTVHATIGRAFVTPDAYHVAGYSENIAPNGQAAVTRGNPNLKTENSTTWDAGLRFQQKALGLSADLTYFRTHVIDRITTQRSIPATEEKTDGGHIIASRTTYVNANEASIRGLEAELAYDFGALRNASYSLRLFTSTTLTSRAEEITRNSDGTETVRDIFNVADITANYGLDYGNQKGWHARLSGRYVGNRKDTDFNDPKYPQIEYPEFMVLDFSAGYTYAQQHTVSLFVNNLSDENYYEKRGYNLAGRNFALRYGFNF